MNDASDIVRSELLRQVAHDLKNPLTAARVLAEMLMDEVQPGLTRDLEDIVEAIDMAAVTAEGLADLARYEVGDEPTYAPEVVDLMPLVAEVVERKSFSRVTSIAPGSSGSARADEDALLRALTAVLLNGRRMLKPNGRLCVTVAAEVIEVLHTGVHVSTDARDALLRVYGGTELKALRVRSAALGLGYPREVVFNVGGSLELDQRDDGLVAVIRFPAP